MMKKKTIALLLALLMFVSSVPMVTVASAEGGDWSFGDEDLFSGNAQVFEGADGSKTEIFENGSMRTTYPDGRKEGLDKDGNHFEESKDGTIKFQTLDGGYGTKRPDGSGEGYYPDGTSEIYHADGSHTEYNVETGLTMTFDKDGKWTGVSLDENNKIEFYDENGDSKTGTQTVTDKTGRTITYTLENEPYKDGDGEHMKEFSLNFTDKNGQRLGGVNWTRDGEGNEALDIKDADGLSMTRVETDDSCDIHVVSNDGEYRETKTTDEFGNKTVTSSLVDNEKGHNNQTIVFDKNGAVVKNDIDMKWTEDGKTTTATNDDNHIYATVENKDGTTSEHTVTYGEDGKQSVKSVHTYKDGSKLESEVTGTDGVVTGRTDKYIDKNGNEKSTDGKKFKNADGSTIEFDKDGVHQIDEDGGKMDFTADGVSFEKEDGSESWVTTYDGDILKVHSETAGLDMYIDAETGERVFTNEQAGAVLRYKENEDGEPSGSIVTKDGLRIVVKDGALSEYYDPNGGLVVCNPEDDSWNLTRPDGTIVESDGKGNVYVDGKQIKKDGEWVKGYEKAEEVGIVNAIDEQKPAEPADTDAKGGELSIDSIVGTYYNSGNSYITKSNEWQEAPQDLFLEVYKVSDTQINIKISMTGKSVAEPLDYDHSTGIATVTYKAEGVAAATYTSTFTDLGSNRYAIHFVMDWGGELYFDINCEKG